MTDSICTFRTLISSDGYRRAVSSNDLQPGAIVSQEEPFSTMILQQHSHKYCANCLVKFKARIIGKRCLGGCHSTFFCDRDCQKQYFPIHKYTCKQYSKILESALQRWLHLAGGQNEADFPWENFLLGRNVYIQLCLLANVPVKDKCTNLPSLPCDIEALCEGPSHPDRNETIFYEHTLSKVIVHSFGIIDDPNAVWFFYRLLCKFRFNNFGIQSSLQTVIASGIFPRGAILNHSCDPNCILNYDRGIQVIRTIKPVSKGEELFHSYTDICQPTSIRQSRLMETYFIRCDCERCQGHSSRWKMVENALVEGNDRLSPEEAQNISKLTLTAQQISMENVDDGIDSLTREYETLCEALSIQEANLGRYNLERYKTQCLVLNVAMFLGSNVLSHAEATVDFLTFVCNEYHPLLLLQKMTLSELYDAHGKTNKARSMYKELVDACKVALGENHEFVHHYNELLSS